MGIEFTKATKEDISAAKEIYTYYVENSTATFHTGEITDEIMENILFHQGSLYESFMIKENNISLGYVLLAPYSTRQAYRRIAEVTIYVSPSAVARGIGSAAIDFIISKAKEKQIKVLLSLICGENVPSIKLFEKFNFTKAAHLTNVGEKFGRLLDLVIYEKEL